MDESFGEPESLDEDDLRSRLSFDYKTVTLMNSPLMKVESYRNLDDLLARRNLVNSPEEGHLATHYRVSYQIRTLVGRGRYSDNTTVRFDLFANNNYPYNEPTCWVIDSEIPWSPHFLKDHWICIGQIWERAKGKMLLGELMVHMAKLLNFDEPEYEDPTYGGWHPDAVEYWETTLGREPITKNLVYPQVLRRVPRLALEAETQLKAFSRRTIVESPAPAIRIRPEGPVDIVQPRIRLRPQ